MEDHGAEELCGDGGPFATEDGASEDFFLESGDLFEGDFDAQVAAGDHDAVGGVEDLVEVFEDGGEFEFGHDGDFGLRAEDFSCGEDVVGGSDEGDGDDIDIGLGDVLEIAVVFFGECFDGEFGVGDIDAFVGGEWSAADDAGVDIWLLDGFDEEFDGAVGEHDGGAGFDVLPELFVLAVDDGVVALDGE